MLTADNIAVVCVSKHHSVCVSKHQPVLNKNIGEHGTFCGTGEDTLQLTVSEVFPKLLLKQFSTQATNTAFP